MRITARELHEAGIVDEVVAEPLGGAHRNAELAASILGDRVAYHMKRLMKIPPEDLVEGRYERYRQLGVYHEAKERELEVQSG